MDAAGPHSRRSTGSRRRSSRSWASSPVPRLRSCGGRPRPCRRPSCPDPTAGPPGRPFRARGPRRFRLRGRRLIGRGHDHDAVLGLLREHRVVALTGPGGRRQVDPGAGGGADVPGRCGGWVRRPRSSSRSSRRSARPRASRGPSRRRPGSRAREPSGPRRWPQRWGRGPLLLVLDNCEHLLDASAALVDAILDAGAGARILVTSREPLRVDGESEYRLGSLGPESAELFVERAAAAGRPGSSDADDPRVVELCRATRRPAPGHRAGGRPAPAPRASRAHRPTRRPADAPRRGAAQGR